MTTTGSLKQLRRTGSATGPISATAKLDLPSIHRFDGMAEILTPASSVDDLDISVGMLTDILLRLTYNEGEVSATHAEEITSLPYRVMDSLLQQLQQEHFIEVSKAVGSLGRRGYVYTLTDAGRARAREAQERTQYVGPAPVPLDKYTKAVLAQASIRKLSRHEVQSALSHLILPKDFDRKIGPAVNAGSSLFLYARLANGKTTIAEGIAEMLGDGEPVWMPYAVTIGGAIVQLFDTLIHKHNPEERGDADKRWASSSVPQ